MLLCPVGAEFTDILQIVYLGVKNPVYYYIKAVRKDIMMIKTWKPTTAGILSIISGASGIILGLLAFVRAHNVERVIRHVGLDFFGFLLVVFGILAIAGGIFALQRKTWGFALTGAICAIFSPGWVLGILATIFVSISKNEFAQSPASMT